MAQRDALWQTPGWRAMPVGDEVSLFDATTGRALRLNRTAADVYALADGEHTVDELVAVLARAYAVTPQSIAEDVANGVRELVDAGALRVSG
jgi:hypothetical protein